MTTGITQARRRYTAMAVSASVLFSLAGPAGPASAQSAPAASPWTMVGTEAYLSGGNSQDYTDASNKVTDLVTDGGVLYAGTQDGVYALQKGAWHLVGSSRGFDTGSLISAYGTLFATFAGIGVAFFTHGAWYQAGKSQKMNAGPLAVVGHTLYAGTDKGVFDLQANGSWRAVGSAMKLTSASFLANLGGRLYADGTSPIAQGSNDLYVDNGGKWQAVGGGLGSYFSPLSVSALVRYDGTLYAATDNGVYAYTGNPANPSTKGTWKEVGLDSIAVNSLLIRKGVLYAGTTGDLNNGGVYAFKAGSWKQVGPSFNLKNGYDASADVHSLADLNGVLYAGTDWGVYSFR